MDVTSRHHCEQWHAMLYVSNVIHLQLHDDPANVQAAITSLADRIRHARHATWSYTRVLVCLPCGMMVLLVAHARRPVDGLRHP